jgi:putative transposase
MNKTFRYRIYLTKQQERTLNEWLALCCETYNAALDERKSAYRMAGASLSYAHQCSELPEVKEARPELQAINSQVLQDVLKRVDLANIRLFSSSARRLQTRLPSFSFPPPL